MNTLSNQRKIVNFFIQLIKKNYWIFLFFLPFRWDVPSEEPSYDTGAVPDFLISGIKASVIYMENIIIIIVVIINNINIIFIKNNIK